MATRIGIATAFTPNSKYKVYWAMVVAADKRPGSPIRSNAAPWTIGFRRYVHVTFLVTVQVSPITVSSMWLIRLYIRVLGQLGSDLRIGGLLALANVALAVSAFAEPILFGRIIDVLTRAQVPARRP